MKPRILLTNDDGIQSPGLEGLLAELACIGQVTVVAPEGERSGASHSLTLHRPLRLRNLHSDRFSLDGTPTDCIQMGLTRILNARPDLVVSGVNAGSNVGEDVTYSGTVAAAFEATLYGIPAFSISLKSSSTPENYTPAASFARVLAGRILREGLPDGVFLNVNIPAGAVRGIRWTRQGRRVVSLSPANSGPSGNGKYLWIQRNTGSWRPDPDADFLALQQGMISITPLRVDWTHTHQDGAQVSRWKFSVPGIDLESKHGL